MATLLLAAALFVVGGLYVYFVDDPGSERRAAVHRLSRLLWGMTVASLLSGIVVFVAIIWFLIGAVWMLVFNSDRLAPADGTRTMVRRLVLWPQELLVYAATGDGSDPGLRPPIAG